MSPRAAWRLELLGFTDVYDYVPGKAAWLGFGLPSEGRRRPEQRIGAIADADVPVLAPDATVADAAGAMGDADVAVVLNEERVVLGLVRREVLGLDPATPIGAVVQPGPSTFRPSMTVKELVAYLDKGGDTRALVTTSDGRWIGLIRRSDVVGRRPGR